MDGLQFTETHETEIFVIGRPCCIVFPSPHIQCIEALTKALTNTAFPAQSRQIAVFYLVCWYGQRSNKFPALKRDRSTQFRPLRNILSKWEKLYSISHVLYSFTNTPLLKMSAYLERADTTVQCNLVRAVIVLYSVLYIVCCGYHCGRPRLTRPERGFAPNAARGSDLGNYW